MRLMMKPISWKSFRHRRAIWMIFLFASLIIAGIWPLIPDTHKTTETFIAIMSAIWGAAYFFHKSHADDAKFMKELLEYFNDRYNINSRYLNRIIKKKGKLSKLDKETFIDYFNLCAEEWVFYDAGYIYENVWSAWENGMKPYWKDTRVMELWKDEDGTNSYYGFKGPGTN